MSKHTPAPWTVSELDARGEVSEYHIFIEPDVAVIERKVETRNEGRDMANARLIATALLLEALEAICNEQDAQEGYATCATYDRARAAIRAARGKHERQQ